MNFATELATYFFEDLQDLKKQIEEYVIINHDSVDNLSDTNYKKQGYILMDKCYYLNTEQIKHITYMLRVKGTSQLMHRTISRKSSFSLKTLESVISIATHNEAFLDKMFEDKKDSSIQEKNELMTSIILKVLESSIFKEVLMDKDFEKVNYKIPLMEFFRDLGAVFVSAYKPKNVPSFGYILYPDDPDSIWNSTMINTIYNMDSKLKVDDIVDAIRQDINTEVDVFILNEFIKALVLSRQSYLKYKDKEEKNIFKMHLVIKRLKVILDKFYIQKGSPIGEHIIEALPNYLKISTEIGQKRNGQKITRLFLEIIEDVSIILYLSGGSYRPLLDLNINTREANTELDTFEYSLENNLKINFGLNDDVARNNSHEYYVRVDENFKDKLNKTLPRNAVDNFFFMEWMTHLFNVIKNKNIGEDHYHIICTLYGLDFRIILSNNANPIIKEFINKLIVYSLDFESFRDKKLKEDIIESSFLEDEDKIKIDIPLKTAFEVDNANEALLYYYNKITSLKLYLFRLFKEIYLFKDFIHFYIPMFIAYTGREFPFVHPMSLGNHKIVHAFILYRKEVDIVKLTKDDFYTLKDIIYESLKTKQGKEELIKNEYNAYLEYEHKKDFNYILSYLKTESRKDFETLYEEMVGKTFNFSQYFTFFVNNCKKSKNILRVMNHFYNTFTGTNRKTPYIGVKEELDATQSVGQLSHIVTKLAPGAEIYNIIGDKETDGYADYLNAFNDHLNHLNHLNKLIEEVIKLRSDLYNLICSLWNKIDEISKETSEKKSGSEIKILSQWMVALQKYLKKTRDMENNNEVSYRFNWKVFKHPKVKMDLQWCDPDTVSKIKKMIDIYDDATGIINRTWCKDIMVNLLAIKRYREITKITNNNPLLTINNIFNNREIAKALKMTFFYGAGQESFKASIIKVITLKAYNEGYAKYLQKPDVNRVCKYMINFFTDWSENNMPVAKRIRHMAALSTLR